MMLHALPVELSLTVLSYLPLQTLCPLPSLSRKWFNFFSQNQSTIFRNAAILHGYTHPDTYLLEDALSKHKGSPWEGVTDWKDFCRRSLQLHVNWEGNGRVVARLLKPPGGDVHRLKVDEKVGILITTHILGGLSVIHLFSGVLLWSLPRYYVRSNAHCEYENGYLVFDRFDGKKEVWRLANDFVDGEPEVAPYAPPDEKQKRTYEFFATIPTHQRYAPHGHFRPWARLSFPTFTRAYRLAYPTLICAGMNRSYLHDVRTGALVQTIDLDIRPEDICYVDVNERHAFVCEPEVLHVYSRADGGNEVLRIQNDVSFSKVLSPPTSINSDPFVSVLPLHPGVGEHLPLFLAAHVSRDGCDLVIMSSRSDVFLIRDFERICRGEISLETSGPVLRLSEHEECFYLAFEHGHVCVATSLGLYIIAVDRDKGDLNDLAKVLFVRPFLSIVDELEHGISCMQLTDRRVYFTLDDSKRRLGIPLFKDEKTGLDLLSPKEASSTVEQLDEVRDLEFGRHHHTLIRDAAMS